MCIFSKIVTGEIPSDKVLESDDFLAFRDINPQAKTHILVIPKIRYKDFDDLDPLIMTGMSAFIQQVVQQEGLTKGYRLITNVGEHGGQEVPYVHFHILGGEKLKPTIV